MDIPQQQQDSNNNSNTLPMNYPMDAHITIHYQNWNNNSLNDLKHSNEELSDSSSDSDNSSSISLNSNSSYSFSNNYKTSTNNNNSSSNTPLRIVQTVLNISNHYNIEQCQNNNNTNTNTAKCNHLARRFSEPIYIDNGNLASSTATTPMAPSNTAPSQNNICTRHHHRRNSTAIKFNKPLYKRSI